MLSTTQSHTHPRCKSTNSRSTPNSGSHTSLRRRTLPELPRQSPLLLGRWTVPYLAHRNQPRISTPRDARTQPRLRAVLESADEDPSSRKSEPRRSRGLRRLRHLSHGTLPQRRRSASNHPNNPPSSHRSARSGRRTPLILHPEHSPPPPSSYSPFRAIKFP